MDLPLGLVQALETGKCVLVLGAGIGHNSHRSDGEPIPDGPTLARKLAEHFNVAEALAEPDPLELAPVAELIEQRRGRPALERQVELLISGYEPDEELKWLVTRPWKAIYTTNYDTTLGMAFDQTVELSRKPVHVSVTASLRPTDIRLEVPIYYLHGRLGDGRQGVQLVLTETDYTKYSDRRHSLFELFKLSYATDSILYVGYANLDTDWRQVTADLRREFAPSEPPTAYRVAPSTNPLAREVLNGQGVLTVDGTLSELVLALKDESIDWRVASEGVPASQTLPAELRHMEELNPAATSRLLDNWQYVNAADFNQLPNTKAFLRGDTPNWGVIGNGIGFERDIEEPLVEQLLDFATASEVMVRNYVVLGSAGCGITSCLMQVAGWLARAKASPIFMLKPGMDLQTSDIEFALTNLDRAIFFVDDAGDWSDRLWIAFQRGRSLGKSFSIVMGERLNEWRDIHPRIGGTEVALDALSDIEVPRVIECLSRAGELGVLEPLDDAMRVSNISQRNQNELLVVLREATEGKAFDAIIESEYEGLANDLARRAYAVVSCFYRLGALVRESLVAHILGVTVSELYSELSHLEGVLRFEAIGQSGAEALRSRHHVIAELVWQRCIGSVERESIQLAALGALNLNFGLDAKAFEAFTRRDQAVDSVAGLDGKTKFFEAAARKAPDNAYVRQHYARMLRRQNLPELALAQVENAILLEPKNRIFHHTKGLILKDMALDSDSIEVGRRRLAQSESELESSIFSNPQDEYAYVTLIELYLGWADRTDDAAVSLAYVTRAEETLRKGLAAARRRESLYVVSSKIELAAGNQPARLEALRQAIRENPESLVAPYLLGTALRVAEDLPESEAVLRKAILTGPDNPALAMSFALTREQQGAPYSECLSIVRAASLYGLSDARFISIYGGMLAMAGQTEESDKVFIAARRIEFSIRERQTKWYRPRPSGEGPVFTGYVRRIYGGFAFLRVEGMPDFYFGGSSYQGRLLEDEMQITFGPAFTVRGPAVGSLSP